MELILYSKPDCHLCDRLVDLLRPHLASRGWTLSKRNILDNDAWFQQYQYRIPVLVQNGREILEGNPTPEQVNAVFQAGAFPGQGLRTMSSTNRPILRISSTGSTPASDPVSVEEPLEIRLGDEPLAVTMRTPSGGDDLDLAAGFCFTEGLYSDPDDLVAVQPCLTAEHGNIVIVTLTDQALARRAEQIRGAKRELYMSSSCGLCGKQTLDRIETHAPKIRGNFTVSPTVIGALPDAMRQAQATFDQTGGLHAAAIFDTAGKLRYLREDVGRHNAVDKVIGCAVRINQIPLDPAILLVSGRSSFEIMQKAAMAGIAMVCAVSAPSSLAVDFAVRMNMTLVGFLRPGRMNVYHGAHRIRS